MKQNKTSVKNEKGQGLIEYLIIVAIVAIGSISVIKVVGANLNVQFANVAQALGGNESNKKKAYKITDTMVKKRDLGSFFEGAVNDSRADKGQDSQ
jgi:pilus assembly protein Flp/PilA